MSRVRGNAESLERGDGFAAAQTAPSLAISVVEAPFTID